MFKAIKRFVGVVGVALLAFRAIGSFLSWVDKQDDIVGYTHHGVAIYRSDLEKENE